MKIAILKERRPHESRVAGSPDSIKKLRELGAEVVVEAGAGDGASVTDQAFKDAGATIAKGAAELRKPGFLHDRIAPLWGEACRRITVEGVTLDILPDRVAVTQPIVGQTAMKAVAVVSATTVLAQGDAPVCPPLPEKLDLLERL